MEHLTIYSEPQPDANIKWYIEVEYLKNIFIEKNHRLAIEGNKFEEFIKISVIVKQSAGTMRW